MKNQNIKIGLVQLACTKDIDNNLQRTLDAIRGVAASGANVICLQELFRSTYFCDVESYDNFSLAEQIPGPSTEILGKLAAELGVVIVASLFEKRAAGVYHNTAAVLDADGTYLGKYRKMHIPDDPGYFEKFYFTPGDLGYKVFDTRYGKLGVLVCWDQWYPEAARITALKGADILFYPTAIGWHQSQDAHTNRKQFEAWQTMQRSHAISNGVHVVSVNRTGVEGEMQFWGGSFVADPFGEILYQAPHKEEVTQAIEIDINESDTYRVHWPFLRDRRIESYAPLTKRLLDDESEA